MQHGLFDAESPSGPDKPAAPSRRKAPPPALELIPYGKYQGQPLSLLLVHAEYALWLMGARHAHLRRHHPQLLQWLHKHFGPPASTPEQNRLQNRFLQPDFCLRLLLRVNPDLPAQLAATVAQDNIVRGWQARLPARIAERYQDYGLAAPLAEGQEPPESHRRHKARVLQALERELPRLLVECPGTPLDAVPAVPADGAPVERWWEPVLQLDEALFEVDGAHVQFTARAQCRVRVDDAAPGEGALVDFEFHDEVRIELRAQLGDDYPSVLRTMRAKRCNVLLIGQFEADGACWEELVEIYARRGIRVALLDEVLVTAVPTSVRKLKVPALEPAALLEAAREALEAFDAEWLQRGRGLQPRLGL
ncbi:hypothetical protein [Azohydromonas aeria]|uniref:hypothetical protein n=1 Tax=Azohydromonas aeria TaxID=2590212 RepID=UPI0012F819CB|nr:hypothetical protein [Azohydromonas aeria]